MQRNKPYKIIWIISCLLFPGLGASAQKLTGDQVVAKIDKSLTSAKDQHFVYKLVTYEANKAPRQLKFEVHIKGTKMRRLQFLAPGDVRGMRFLILDVDQQYVYMPAYKKVRRVASHVKSQGFMGSAYSQDEMAIVTYGDVYTARIISEDEKTWTLDLTRRDGQTFPYPKMSMVVRKDILQPIEMGYYNDQGKIQKTETRTSWECNKFTCNPRIMTMVDHSRGDIKSVMIRQEWQANTGIEDRFFTVRALQRQR